MVNMQIRKTWIKLKFNAHLERKCEERRASKTVSTVKRLMPIVCSALPGGICQFISNKNILQCSHLTVLVFSAQES